SLPPVADNGTRAAVVWSAARAHVWCQIIASRNEWDPANELYLSHALRRPSLPADVRVNCAADTSLRQTTRSFTRWVGGKPLLHVARSSNRLGVQSFTAAPLPERPRGGVSFPLR